VETTDHAQKKVKKNKRIRATHERIGMFQDSIYSLSGKLKQLEIIDKIEGSKD
tara:strand:- start:1600 stop:1758 length:159 start_codon:yes stop_codon:yes gene_type:complete